MNGLALYAGYGGIELGLKLAVSGYRTVCYVEREAYPASILVQRMADKILDEAPVWDDAGTFDGKPWRGKVDIISAGFPCQPVSVAGKRQGHEDERWQWPNVLRLVNEIRPRFVFLENVPGIFPYVREITAALTQSGYLGTYGIFSAAGCGAPHRRQRWFCLAYSSSTGTWMEEQGTFKQGWEETNTPKPEILRQENGKIDAKRINSNSQDVPDAHGNESSQPQGRESDFGGRISDGNKKLAVGNTKRGGCSRESRRRSGQESTDGCSQQGWWAVEPDLGRLAHGVADRVDRLRCLGNGVIPVVAAKAWCVLLARLVETYG